MNEEIKKFLDYLKNVKRLSKNTIENNKYALMNFEKRINKKPADFNQQELESYSKYLTENYPATTHQTYLNCIKNFIIFLHSRSLTNFKPDNIIIPKIPEKNINTLTQEQIIDMIDGCKAEKYRAIISLFYDTGLRLSELVNLKIKMIDFDNKKIQVLGKGSRARLVFFTEKTGERIKDYINNRQNISEYVFSNDSKPITTRAVQMMIKKEADRCGLQDVTVHTFRHSFATLLLTSGLDIRIVQELLGHKSISTTQMYTHVTNSQLQQYHQKYHQQA